MINLEYLRTLANMTFSVKKTRFIWKINQVSWTIKKYYIVFALDINSLISLWRTFKSLSIIFSFSSSIFSHLDYCFSEKKLPFNHCVLAIRWRRLSLLFLHVFLLNFRAACSFELENKVLAPENFHYLRRFPW